MSLNLIFKALSDPIRREILQHLRRRDLTAGEIAARFSLTWPTVSYHLQILKEAGMVIDERKGQNIVYSLNTSVLEDVIQVLFEFMNRKPPSSKLGK